MFQLCLVHARRIIIISFVYNQATNTGKLFNFEHWKTQGSTYKNINCNMHMVPWKNLVFHHHEEIQ